MIYLCMSDEQFPRRIAFAFLADIKTRFMSMYRNTFKTAMAFGMNEEFSRVLQRQMVTQPMVAVPLAFGQARELTLNPLHL